MVEIEWKSYAIALLFEVLITYLSYKLKITLSAQLAKYKNSHYEEVLVIFLLVFGSQEYSQRKSIHQAMD